MTTRSTSWVARGFFIQPTILHDPTTELPTYVGLATLLLALIGATRLRSSWRVGFWLVMSLLGLGMALGTTTPLVTLAYYVPLYSWFRNLSRHMFLFAFGVSVLAGFGLAAFERRQVSLRGLRPAAAMIGWLRKTAQTATTAPISATIRYGATIHLRGSLHFADRGSARQIAIAPHAGIK